MKPRSKQLIINEMFKYLEQFKTGEVTVHQLGCLLEDLLIELAYEAQALHLVK